MQMRWKEMTSFGNRADVAGRGGEGRERGRERERGEREEREERREEQWC
jgi:hypothetical protein